MNGNVFASSLSASSTIINANGALADNSHYAVIVDNGCTTLTLPSMVLTATSSLAMNGRMFMIKNVSSANCTLFTSASGTFDGGSSTLVLKPNQWVIVQALNSVNRWNVHRPEAPGQNVIDVTYAQLFNLIGVTGNTGATTGFYRITDFATKGYVIGGSGTTYTGVTEPLIVSVYYNSSMGATAQISREAFSPSFPNDIIYYDPFPQNWCNDKSFCLTNDANAMISGFKGVIFFRHDLKKNIKGTYDWRNARIRRWSVSPATPVFSGATAYNAGDVVLSIPGPPYTPYVKIVSDTGAGGSITDGTWLLMPTSVCAVNPYNNTGLSPADTWRWDLCMNNYAHSATGATFAAVMSLDLSSPVDSTTFIPHNGGNTTTDPLWTRDIDLGTFNWNLGESIMPHPAAGGPTAGATARTYGTIVNQNRLNAGSLGVNNGAVGFNRLNNIDFGPRAWGNTITSAGFEAIDNDTYDVRFTGRAEHNCMEPYPITPDSPAGASTINGVAGFRHLLVQQAVNCFFCSVVLDSKFGAVRDSWFINSAALDIGSANAIGPLEYVQGATYQSLAKRGFSIGNIFQNCANVKTDQVRWSFFSEIQASKFADVLNCYMSFARANNIQALGDFRKNTFMGTTSNSPVFSGRATSNYFNGGTLDTTQFIGGLRGNNFDSWTIERNVFVGEVTGVGASAASSYFGGNVFQQDLTYSATAGSGIFISNSVQEFFGPNTWPNGFTMFDTRISGSFSNNYISSQISRSTLNGTFIDNYINYIDQSNMLGGMTGVTGLALNNATVVGTVLDELDMSAATQSSSNVGKLYMLSNTGTKWMARFNDTAGVGSWGFFGATA